MPETWFDLNAPDAGVATWAAPTVAPTAAAEEPGGLPPPPPGFDATKWYDLTHTSEKYVAGRILAQGGSSQDVVAALGTGWTVLGPDKIEGPDGSTVDLFFDYSGQGTARPQWTVLSPEAASDSTTSPTATSPTVSPPTVDAPASPRPQLAIQ